MRAFRRARPAVRLTIVPLDFTEHVTALVENRVDAAFVRPAPDDERIAVDVLTTGSRIVCVPVDGPFGDAATLRLADVLDLPLVEVPDVTPAVFAVGQQRPRDAPRRPGRSGAGVPVPGHRPGPGRGPGAAGTVRKARAARVRPSGSRGTERDR